MPIPPRRRTREKLPDAMPDVEVPTLLVVCDTHRCVLIDVGHHTLLIADTIRSKEVTFTDHEGRFQSPAAVGRGGMTSGTADPNVLERNRLKEFANRVVRYLQHAVGRQGIGEWYLSAPGKFLSVLQSHLSQPLKGKLGGVLEGNFVKERPREIFLRFRPEFQQAMAQLRDSENYSPRRQPPKKAKPRRQ